MTDHTTPALPDTTARPLPPLPARIHFVGIGGIGMSGLARLLRARGYAVSGSDATPSAMTAALASEGMRVVVGHDDPTLAVTADAVVTTRAASQNAEVAAARSAGVRLIKRGDLLAALANARRCVAVAGSHGKSTTCGMLVTALRGLGADPSYAIGAMLGPRSENAAPGSGEAMVVEADEFDHAFLALTPTVAVITNVEYDHPDIFADQDSYDADFARFAGQVRRGGTLIMPADDPGCARVRDRADFAPPALVVTFGERADADWQLTRDGVGWRVVAPDGATVPLRLTVTGAHNARNATAALAALAALGHDPATAAAALAAFGGVGRRFERIGEAAGVTVFDDYAHHPSEIRATLRAARECYPDRRLWAVFQPHTYSRTKALLADFGAAFGDADRVMILDVYAAREADVFGVTAADLRALLPAGTLAARGPADAAACLAGLVEPGDVVFLLGAGDVTAAGPALLARLMEKE